MLLCGVYPLVSKKTDVLDFTDYRKDKESHTFQWQKPLILQHDADFINIYIKFFNKSTHSFVVLIDY